MLEKKTYVRLEDRGIWDRRCELARVKNLGT